MKMQDFAFWQTEVIRHLIKKNKKQNNSNKPRKTDPLISRRTLSKNKTLLEEKLREALSSVLPVTLIVLLLCVTITPLPTGLMLAFLMGALMLIIGMGFFTLGADLSMTPMGEFVGSQMTKSRKLSVIIFVALFVGVMITLSEPDLQVLANQVPTIPNLTLILSVAIGVGVFLVIAMLRVLFSIRLRDLLVVFYAIVFILAIFVPKEFLAIAFDSGGVTTGPMTVPFIMALGVGVASIRSDKHAEDDSFGMVALCSVGPILAVLILGLIYHPDGGTYSAVVMPDVADSREMFLLFVRQTPHYMKETAIAVGPIVLFFFVYQLFTERMSFSRLVRIAAGVVYTFIGLVLFLTGVNVGFMPAGYYLGTQMGQMETSVLIIPIAMVIGFFIVAAEPAVHVLTHQVEEITSGMIPKHVLRTTLSIGVAISVGLAMTRVLTGMSIFWLVVPGYAIALILSFFVPKIFVSIAFDSGGVASGPMTATFLLPFAMGACEALGGNVVTDAFGVVAMVAMIPLIAIQVLGLSYQFKLRKTAQAEAPVIVEEDIIDV